MSKQHTRPGRRGKRDRQDRVGMQEGLQVWNEVDQQWEKK